MLSSKDNSKFTLLSLPIECKHSITESYIKDNIQQITDAVQKGL